MNRRDTLSWENVALAANKIPDAIQWYEGMLLAPQHLQQLSIRHEALVEYCALAIQPYFWGVRTLLVDQNRLSSGEFRVLQLEAVMPDGLIVSHTPSSGNELHFNLTPKADEIKDHPATIHLAVPARSSGAMNSEFARYESLKGEPVVDENTGEGEVRIPRLKPHLVLVAEDIPPSKYVSFPLAKVQFKDDAFSLTDYIPPTTSVSLKSPIGEMGVAIAKKLREKAMALSDQVQAPSAPGSMPLVIENKRKIQCLVAGLPPLESILSTGESHPYSLYLALSGAAGHLAALGSSLVPPVFAPYDHNDLRTTFEQVQDFAFRMISEGISEKYLGFPFHFSNGVFALSFDRDWVDRRLILAVRAQAGMSEAGLIRWGEECLIGSKDVIQSLREKRILGASRQVIAGDEDLIPPRGVIFFVLKASREFIRPDEELQIVAVSEAARAMRPAEIILHVSRPTV
jgi:type VI secretion system protein ImpJ